MMNRDQMIEDRDKYLQKLKSKLSDRFPNAFDFYENPENYTAEKSPDYKIKQNSRRPITPSKSLLTEAQLYHLLKRVKPGFSFEEFNTFKSMNTSEIVQLLLTETPIDVPVNNYNNGIDIEDPDVPFGESFVEAPYNNELEGERTVALKTWFIEDLLKNSTSMHSTMWLFWHNHLVTELWGIFNGNYGFRYLKLLRDYAFGNFKELIYKITIDPAMLIYLNTIYNDKEAPDENYARELQELFTIGKGPDANYTEADVQAAARVLTGWNLDWENREPIFYPWSHETADKQFSEFYGNKVIEGKTGEDGQEELQEMIDMIFENNEVAPYICRRLYTFFCYSSIDEWAEENIIQPLAQTFRDNNYEIKPVLEQLLNSEHFYDEVNYGAIIKTPVDVLLGFWRSTEVDYTFDTESDIHNKALVHRSMLWSMSDWGLQIGDPPNVAGWPAFYQIPTFDKTWITTSTIVRRIGYTDSLTWWGFWSPNYVAKLQILEFVKKLDNPSDPNLLIGQMENIFLGLPLAEDTRTGMKSILLSGQGEDFYWTNAWNLFIADESVEMNRNIVQLRLTNLFHRFFNLAEFQLK